MNAFKFELELFSYSWDNFRWSNRSEISPYASDISSTFVRAINSTHHRCGRPMLNEKRQWRDKNIRIRNAAHKNCGDRGGDVLCTKSGAGRRHFHVSDRALLAIAIELPSYPISSRTNSFFAVQCSSNSRSAIGPHSFRSPVQSSVAHAHRRLLRSVPKFS